MTIVDDANNDGVINKDELGNDNVQVKVDVNHDELVEGGQVTLSVNDGEGIELTLVNTGTDAAPVYELSDSNYSYNNGTITWTETVAEGASIKVDATQTDSDGNVSIPSSDEAKVDTEVGARIDLDEVTGDGIVSYQEIQEIQLITGTVGGSDVKPGDTVKIYRVEGLQRILLGETEVLSGNTFELPVPGAQLVMDNPASLYATVEVSDLYGNTEVEDTTERYFVFTDIPESPVITNISDDSAASDYSEVTLHGTGEPGSAILLFDEDNNQVNVAPITVDNDGNWTTDISNLVSTPINDNEFFTAKQVDNYGNTSESSNTVHYYHGDFDPAQQETTDDFVLLGGGDDQFNVTVDDIDNRLVVDGGSGTDTAVFDFSLDSALVQLNADGSVTITESNSDVNTFIEFENFNFTDGGKTVEELFAPSVTIVRDEDEFINSDRPVVSYNVALPVGAAVGATLSIEVEGQLTETKVLTQSDIDSGSLSFDVDMDTVVDGELNIDAELTYQDQPAGTQFIGTDALSTNIDPSASSFSIDLGTEQSAQFTFDSHVSDAEDDLSSTDSKDVQLSIIDLPELGSLYVVDGQTRTLIDENTVLSEDSQIEYVLDETVNSDLSFDASEDFNNINGLETSYTLDSGVIISGGRFDGDRPDSSSNLTTETLHYDSAENESGLGVGDKELDVSTKDFISIDFTKVGDSNATEVTVTEVNIDFGSVWAHYADNNSADAEIQVILFKDGVQVGNDPYIFDDDSNSAVYDGSGEFTANIQLDGGFDEIRVYTVHGDQSSQSNSNITLQGVEVVDAIVSEKIIYEATDSDKGTDTGVITISTSSTQDSTNKAPVLNDSQFDASNEDQVVSLSLDKLNITDADGDQAFITDVTVDPSYGSVQLVIDSEGQVTSAEFTPASDKHFDSVPFTVTVSDGVKSAEGTSTLVVKAVADKPNVTAVFGGASNVVISDALHTKLVNADANTSFTESDYAELGHTVMNQYGQTTGTVGNDLIVGSDVSSGDSLIGDANTNPGGTGSDIFVGRDGDDHISGGTGSLDAESAIDTAVYEGNFSEYNLTFVGDTTTQHDWTIVDSLNRDTPEWGSTGDKLYQIERLIFADAIVELNEDGTFNVLQDVGFTVTASVADTDGSEYLDEVRISGLPDSAEIIDKDTGNVLGNVLGGFVTVGDESVWVIDIEGDTTQYINYDNLAVRDSSGEPLDVDVEVVAVDVNENVSTASTSVNVAETNDIMADQGGSVPTTVITLIIDSSGSMASTPSGLSDMRIEYVLQASINLLQNVAAQEGSEDVLVQLIDFDSGATNTGWKTVAEAIAILTTAQEKVDERNYNGIFDAQGGTDYEDGVEAAIAGYNTNPVSNLSSDDTNDVVYFLSDGRDNGDWDSDTNSDWDSFIADKDVTAVGVGSSDNVPASGLKEVAGNNGKVVYIPDSLITTELPKLRPTIGIAGSLLLSLSGLDAVAVMIDESKASVIQKVDTDGNTINLPTGLTFTKDSVGNELVVDIGYGEFRVAQDGSYYFQPSSDSTAIETGKAVAFEILMTVEDSQGVQSQQLITLNLSPSGEVNVVPTSSFNASTGDDQFQGTEQDDIILGHAGNDVLLGAAGDDILFGGDGSDILIGGLGDDILTGGDGDDIFKWVDEPLNNYQDVITDFEVGSDRIDLFELLHDENTMDDVLEHLSAKISDNNQDLELTITNEQGSQTIVLQGQASNLSGFDVDSSGVYSGDELTNLVNSLMTNLPNS
ncbi:Iron-regulated protein FrpC (fragment) [Vibrio coralliirubri]|uniref:Ig-like domain-containing protein n=1 Tax=Vibrio coralliirubri TaxID=1516159 RepID=UPI0006378533